MTHRTLAALAVATAAVALFPFPSVGQTLGGRGRGLDALDESVVIGRMNNDGLDNLIDRDLDVFKVPPAEREQLKAGGDLTALANAGGLKPADRRALAERVAKALDATVEKATDPAVLQQQAYQLTAAGVQPTVDELEYFGANAEASAQLNPVVATVRHLFQKEADLAHARADAIVNQMNNGNFAQLNPKRAAASALKRNAEFSYHRTAYALCLSLPADDTAGRKRTADEAIDYLKKYDDPRSGIQAGIRVVLGKLMLVKGDTKGAKAMLESVYSGPPTKPLPTDAEGNDARYFAAVADLAAGDFAAVTTELSDLNRWQGINYLPKLQPGEQDQVKATDAMLQFRLDTAQADAAANPAEKQKFNDAAITVLSDLLQSQPDPTLHDLVFDQLAGRIPANPDFATLNPLALQAVQQDGFDQFNKKEGEPIDKAKLERGIAASREIVHREGQPGITHQMAVDALYFIAYAEQTKLHDDPAAAEAFVDFMAKFPNEGAKSTDALDHAGYLVFKLHHAADAAHAPDPAEATLYDRFLPLAVNAPYNQKQIAGDYADLLRTQGKYAEALKYYGMVAPNDKGYASVQFRTLLTLYGALGDGKATDAADKKAMADQLQTVAERVDQQAAAAAASAKDDAAKQQALGQVAIARFDAAISARRDLKDPAKSLQWLADFDQKIAGLSNAKSFGQAVTVQQVNDYMDQGKTPEATAALLKLLNDDPDAGEGLMFDLIHQIDHDPGRGPGEPRRRRRAEAGRQQGAAERVPGQVRPDEQEPRGAGAAAGLPPVRRRQQAAGGRAGRQRRRQAREPQRRPGPIPDPQGDRRPVARCGRRPRPGHRRHPVRFGPVRRRRQELRPGDDQGRPAVPDHQRRAGGQPTVLGDLLQAAPQHRRGGQVRTGRRPGPEGPDRRQAEGDQLLHPLRRQDRRPRLPRRLRRSGQAAEREDPGRQEVTPDP